MTLSLSPRERRPRTLIAPCALERDGEGARPVPGRSGHARHRAFDRSRLSGAGTCCGRGPAAVRFMGRARVRGNRPVLVGARRPAPGSVALADSSCEAGEFPRRAVIELLEFRFMKASLSL